MGNRPDQRERVHLGGGEGNWVSSVHRKSPGLVYLRGKIPLSDLQGIFHAHIVHIQKLRAGGLMSSLLTSQPSYPHNSFREKHFLNKYLHFWKLLFLLLWWKFLLLPAFVHANMKMKVILYISTISEHISQRHPFKRLNVSALKY